MAIKTMRIVEELMEIWPNKVCDTFQQFSFLEYFFFVFLLCHIFQVLSIFSFKLFDHIFCIFQVLSSFPGIGLCHKSFPAYQIFILPSISLLIQNSFYFLLLFSPDYYWSWFLLFLPLYLPYIVLYSTNIYYWMYFYCTR